MAGYFAEAVPAEEVPEGASVICDCEGVDVVIFRVKGKLYAMENVCSHDNGPIGEGLRKGYEIECPRHGARFDIRTGDVTNPPAYGPVETYPVKEEDGMIFVEIF